MILSVASKYSGDGIVAGILVLAAMRRKDATLEELTEGIKALDQDFYRQAAWQTHAVANAKSSLEQFDIASEVAQESHSIAIIESL